MQGVTIVVTPRERFSAASRSLENILGNTPPDTPLVYVDAGSPRRIADDIQRQSARAGFELIRVDDYMAPNRARNVGLERVETKYVAFVDNDLLVTPGWLETLASSAEDTGALIVGPLYLLGEFEDGMVHMAGGDFEVTEEADRRFFSEDHRHMGKSVSELSLEREPVDFVEFHCMLVDASWLRSIGGLDERLLSRQEHIDVCMAAHRDGGPVIFEPGSIVTYLPPPPFASFDLPFYLRRWSEAWDAASMRHFYSKWGYENDVKDDLAWMRKHRQRVLAPIYVNARRFIGTRPTNAMGHVLNPAEQLLNRALVRAR